MKTRFTTLIILFATLLLPGCKEREAAFKTYDGFALGTTYSVTVKGTPEQLENVQGIIDEVIGIANDTYSIYNENSLLSRINRNETTQLDPNLSYLLEVAGIASDLSGGKYDVTILPLKEAYGFQAGIPQQEDPNIDSLLRHVGYGKISGTDGHIVKENPGVRIDLNSVAKGYTVDFISNVLYRHGFEDYLVDIGGETFCRGSNPKGEDWKIGIETPVEGNYIKGNSIERIISVSGKGMATSGNYRNFHTDSRGRKYTHIINPLTGENTESNLLSATVVAESCAVADALATMFVAMGLEDSEKLMKAHPEFAVLLIYADGDGEMKTVWSNAMSPYVVP
jgi:Membrane-associated lipoprotein involved in thiamine biosynthesis